MLEVVVCAAVVSVVVKPNPIKSPPKSDICVENKNKRADSNLIKKILNEDQIDVFLGVDPRGVGWSTATVKTALKLKFACGQAGYELVQSLIPLPSLRTIRRHLEGLSFESGILKDVFQLLQIKSTNSADHYRQCSLTLDEMSITESKIYDHGTQKFVGEITFPGESGSKTDRADHALVFMLGGISERWKTPVAFYFTGLKMEGKELKKIILEVIERAEGIGFRVESVTNDMGGCNQAMWKCFGVGKCPAKPIVSNSIIHPFDSTRKLYFFADVPHVFKNTTLSLLNNESIFLPPEIVDKYKLPSNYIEKSHIIKILELQKNSLLKMAPKLTETNLNPKGFHKMRVSTSRAIIHRDVIGSLSYLSEELQEPSMMTTAWFIAIIDKWFYLMTSRHPCNALSHFKEEKYIDSIEFLNECLSIFSKMKIGNQWKPCQTGLLMSTQSILEAEKYFLIKSQFKFLMVSRFSQDCLENLFSVVRSKNSRPTALAFTYSLKNITVSNYIKHVPSGNYDEDDRELPDFLKLVKNWATDKKKYDDEKKEAADAETNQLVNIENTSLTRENLSNIEIQCLYNTAGIIIKKLIDENKMCDTCINSVCTNETTDEAAKLTIAKASCVLGKFNYVTSTCFDFFVKMELIIRQISRNFSTTESSIAEILIENIKLHTPNELHVCNHKIFDIIRKRFVNFRLRIAGYMRRPNETKFNYSSKSMN